MIPVLVLIAKILGYKVWPGVDARRNKYIAFVRRRKNKLPSYFHVYHEAVNGVVIRPTFE